MVMDLILGQVLSALDFAPLGDSKVRSAREGFAQKIVCAGEAEGSWVLVTHADGWRTSYYQLSNIQVDVNGRQVGRGEWLGDVAADEKSAFRCSRNPLFCAGTSFLCVE